MVFQTEATSAKVMRQNGSQRSWKNINREDDWRCEALGARSCRHSACLSVHRRPQALRIRVKAKQNISRSPKQEREEEEKSHTDEATQGRCGLSELHGEVIQRDQRVG